MVDVEDLQREISRVIEAAKDARSDYRSGKSPQWDLVVSEILEPLASVRDSLREEISRRDPSQKELIAIDRDPAPSEFKEATRRYFERLSSARVNKEKVSE